MTGAPTLSTEELDREELLALLARVAPPVGLRQRDLWVIRAMRLGDRATKALDDHRVASEAAEAAFRQVLAAKAPRARLAADRALLRAREKQARAWAAYRRNSRAADAAWAAGEAWERQP